MGANVGTAYVTIQPSMKGFASVISGEVTSVGTSAGSKFTGAFKSSGTGKIAGAMGAIAGVAGSVATSAFNAIGNSMGNAISRVDTLANFPKVMSNLGYSAEEASTSIQRISKSLDGLPSSTDNVASMVQQLAPMCSSLSEATDLGLALNNMFLAGGASSADCARAMQQYTQILNKGKPDLQDWKTLQEVMPGQLNQVAQALLGAGKSSTDLYNALKGGTLTMDDFNNAVMKLNTDGVDGFASFEQQAKDATQGIATAMDNVQNRISAAMAKLINAFGETRISGAINAFSGSFGTIADKLVPAFKLLGNASEGAVHKFEALGATIASKLSPAFESLKSRAQPALDALRASSETVNARLSNLATNTKVAFANTFNQIKSGSLNLMSVTNTFTSIKNTLASIYDDTPAQQYVDKIKAKFSELASALAGGTLVQSILGDSFNELPAGFQNFVTTIDGNLQNVANSFQMLKTKVDEVVAFIGSKFSNIGATIDLTTVGNALTLVFDSMLQKATEIAGFIQPILDTLIGAFQQVGQAFMNAFQNANLGSLDFSTIISLVSPLGQISLLIGQIGPQIQEFASGAITTIAGILSSLAPVIMQLISTITQLAITLLPTVMSTITMLMPYIQQILTIIGQMVQQVMPFIQTLIATLAPAIQSILGALQPLIQAIMNIVITLLPVLTPILTTIISLITALVPVITTIITVVASIATVIANFISSALALVVPIVSAILEAITGVIDFLGGLISVISTVVSTIFNYVAGFFSEIQGAFLGCSTTIDGILNAIKSVWDSVWTAIGNFAKTIWDTIKNVIQTAINAVKTTINNVLNTIKSIWDSIWNGISSFFNGIWDGLKSAAQSGIDAVYNTVTGIKDSICNFFSGAGSWLVDSGRAILEGLGNGIKSAISGVTSIAENAVSSIRNLFPFSPAKEGPFSGHGYTTYSGRALMKGFAEGIAKQAPATAQMIENTMAGLNSLINAPQAQFSLATTAEAYKGTYAVQYSSKTDTLMNALQTLNNNIKAQTNAIKNQEQQIYLDGKTLVGKTAPRMEKELNRRALQGAR